MNLVVSVFDHITCDPCLITCEADFLGFTFHVVNAGLYLNSDSFENSEDNVVHVLNNTFNVFGVCCDYKVVVGKSCKEAVLEFLSYGKCNSAKEFVTFLESVFFVDC